MRSCRLPHAWLATLGALGLVLAASDAVAQPSQALPVGRDTLKARLGSKASDEQRVDDCKVPEARRGASRRPTECARPGLAVSSSRVP